MFDVNAFVGFATQYSFELLTKEELTTVFTWFGDLLQGKRIKFSKSEIENYKTKIQTVYNICNHTFASHAFHEYYGYEKILKSLRRRLAREIKKELNSKIQVYTNQIVLNFKSELQSILMRDDFKHSLETELLPKFHFAYKVKLGTLTIEQLNKLLPKSIGNYEVKAIMAKWATGATNYIRGTIFQQYQSLYSSVMHEFRKSNKIYPIEFPDNQPGNSVLYNMIIDNYPQFRSNYINRIVDLMNSGELYIRKSNGSKICKTLI